jgi:hypothetical protein
MNFYFVEVEKKMKEEEEKSLNLMFRWMLLEVVEYDRLN